MEGSGQLSPSQPHGCRWYCASVWKEGCSSEALNWLAWVDFSCWAVTVLPKTLLEPALLSGFELADLSYLEYVPTSGLQGSYCNESKLQIFCLKHLSALACFLIMNWPWMVTCNMLFNTGMYILGKDLFGKYHGLYTFQLPCPVLTHLSLWCCLGLDGEFYNGVWGTIPLKYRESSVPPLLML